MIKPSEFNSLSFPDAPTRIDCTSLPDLWLRVAKVGHGVQTITLGQSYSGDDVQFFSCFKNEVPIVRCLANAAAIVFDDKLSAECDLLR